MKPLDADGRPIPWMNYPVIDLLRERLTKDLHLFEFGSGFSTTFYAQLVGHVTSIEYDPDWYEQVSQDAPGNVELKLIAQDVDGDYCRAIGATGRQYDVVIVDGRDRVNCLKQSVNSLNDHGIIVLDDSEREIYREGIDFVHDQGFRSLSFDGQKPTLNGIYQASVFYRSNNCLGI